MPRRGELASGPTRTAPARRDRAEPPRPRAEERHARFLHFDAGMVTLYTWTTPNGRKPAILLAELEMPYELELVDLSRGVQKTPEYLAINPNGKIPALVDDGVTVFESGAILLYLAEKANELIPTTKEGRAEVLSWLFWQVGGQGPFFGQLHRFRDERPRDQKAYERFLDESRRLVWVLDRRLADREYVCGYYTIADIAIYPWMVVAEEAMPEALAGARHVRPWLARVGERPAVKLGMALQAA